MAGNCKTFGGNRRKKGKNARNSNVTKSKAEKKKKNLPYEK